MNRIPALESIRGLMALWVVVGHTFKHVGYGPGDFGLFALLADPGQAVDVFIILSGFVIFFLLDNQSLSYRQFIVGRWFRLAPMYLAVLAVAALTLQWQLNLIHASPFAGKAISADAALHADAIRQLPQHLLAHLTMLHGAISDALLPASEYAIIGQAWSISVEWQFYLVAPLLFALVATRRRKALCAVLLGLCALRSLNYGGEGFAVRQAGFFIIGIVSYYAWKHSPRLGADASLLDLLAVAAIALVYSFSARVISLTLWIVVLNAVVAARRGREGVVGRAVLAFLHLPPLQWMGKVSYSVYLLHMLVFYLAQQTVLALAPPSGKPQFALMMLAATLTATLALSALTYRWIELPGIALGRRLGRSLAPRAAPAPA